MHGFNYVIIDMMLADAPRMLSDDEKLDYKNRNRKIILENPNDLDLEMEKIFG